MRILFLSEALSPHISRWQSEFSSLGWETLVASCDYGTDFDGQKLASRVESGVFRYLSLADQIRQLVTGFEPHLVNAHFLPTYGLAAAIAKVHPLVLTLWGSDILIVGGADLLRRLRSRYVLKRADLVVGDSRHLVAEAAKIQPFGKSLVVSFGVKKSWYESGRERRLIDSDRIKLLSTRRLEPIFDVACLIRAARILADKEINFQLTVVGDGSQRQRLQSLTADLDLTSRVEFSGALSPGNMFSAYRKADVYLCAARTDSTSVSLLEAMSQKLYPVVSDIPVHREWLESEQHFFPVSNPEQLAARIMDGLAAEKREAAYQGYAPALRQWGIREDQMKVASLSFVKLIEEYERA